jgi:hypothetical protein
MEKRVHMTIRKSLGCMALAFVVAGGTTSAQGRGDQKVPPPSPATPKQGPGPAENAVILQEFTKRVNNYVRVHNLAAKQAPPLKTSDDPGKIETAQLALAAKIAEMRAGSKQGDIFTPDITRVFRRILVPELKGKDGEETKEALKDDAPPVAPLKINAKYPSGATLPTVPAAVLENLPTLPKEVEYRIIDKHLLLLDAEAGIVIDYIANATP